MSGVNPETNEEVTVQFRIVERDLATLIGLNDYENDPIEFVQTKFIRWLLGVNKFCSSNACRSEVGRFPMRTKTKCRAIKYWLKFCEPEHQNKLSGIAFTDQIGQDKKELWSSKLKRLLNLAGLGDIWSAKPDTPAIMNYIRQRLLDIEQQT